LGDGFEDGLNIRWRRGDDAEDFGGGGLLLQRLSEGTIALLDFIDQDSFSLAQEVNLGHMEFLDSTKLSLEPLDCPDLVRHRMLPDRTIAQAANMRLAGHSDRVAPG
jgi:hypothetical protein